MTGNKRIIRAIDGTDHVEELTSESAAPHDIAQQEDAELPPLLLDQVFEDFDDEEEHSARLGWVAPTLAIVIVALWTGLYGWAISGEIVSAAAQTPQQWVRWIIDWSVPVLLVGLAYLIMMRNSQREANRFAATASMLSRESAELEQRLTVVNRELSLAREFMASQSRELDSLGRIAADRISTHAAELQSLIQSNGAQVDAIGTASETALANMTRLRDDLPVVANSARDVNNQVGATGRTAREQLEKLVTGFERLNEFGTASENQVGILTKRIGGTIERFETQLQRIEQALGARFESLQAQAEAYRAQIVEAETQAVGGMTDRIGLLQAETRAVGAKMREAENEAMEQIRATRETWEQEIVEMVGRLSDLDTQVATASQLRMRELNEEAGNFDDRLLQRDTRFLEEMNRRQEEFSAREAQATEILAKRLAELDDLITERRDRQLAETQKLVSEGEALSQQLDTLNAKISEVARHGNATRDGLGEGMNALSAKLEEERAHLSETEQSLASLTEASIRLLEIIQSGARHSREDLPAAIKTASDELGAVEHRATQVGSAMFAMGQRGDELSAYLIKTNEQIAQTDASIDALQSRVAEKSEEALAKLQGLRGGLQRLSSDSEAFAGKTQDELASSIAKLEEATKATLTALDEGARGEISSLAEKLSSEAVATLERALQTDSAATIEKLEEAATKASGTGKEATRELREQLARVNELTSNLEQRIARARDLAEEQVDHDFARRMALITDSLNSAAIDIGGALSTEITDTQWDAYLKGDRGIFTRRAVRLLENSQAREIADLYQKDEVFHGNVARLIHDFESMMRSMLSTRDGNALSVTMLGSDIGKLYVALAQSIERLRN